MGLWSFNRSALILEVKSSKIVRSNTTISATSSTRLAHSPGPFSSAHHADSAGAGHVPAVGIVTHTIATPGALRCLTINGCHSPLQRVVWRAFGLRRCPAAATLGAATA